MLNVEVRNLMLGRGRGYDPISFVLDCWITRYESDGPRRELERQDLHIPYYDDGHETPSLRLYNSPSAGR